MPATAGPIGPMTDTGVGRFAPDWLGGLAGRIAGLIRPPGGAAESFANMLDRARAQKAVLVVREEDAVLAAVTAKEAAVLVLPPFTAFDGTARFIERLGGLTARAARMTLRGVGEPDAPVPIIPFCANDPFGTLTDPLYEADAPLLGICLGAQIMARAHGAAVRKLGDIEIGFSPLRTTKDAADDPLFGGGDPVPQMQWHVDTFDLPQTAVLLSTNDVCRNQAMRIGRAQYGIQFHFEATRRIVGDWIAHYGAELDNEKPDAVARLRSELDRFSGRAAVYGRQLVDRWVGLIRR